MTNDDGCQPIAIGHPHTTHHTHPTYHTPRGRSVATIHGRLGEIHPLGGGSSTEGVILSGLCGLTGSLSSLTSHWLWHRWGNSLLIPVCRGSQPYNGLCLFLPLSTNRSNAAFSLFPVNEGVYGVWKITTIQGEGPSPVRQGSFSCDREERKRGWGWGKNKLCIDIDENHLCTTGDRLQMSTRSLQNR